MTAFEIEGHHIRPMAIDAVTVPEITVGDASEWPGEKMVRGAFLILLGSGTIKIYRAMRCSNDVDSIGAARRQIRHTVEGLREGVVAAMNRAY